MREKIPNLIIRMMKEAEEKKKKKVLEEVKRLPCFKTIFLKNYILQNYIILYALYLFGKII